jgi:hypothetical protein
MADLIGGAIWVLGWPPFPLFFVCGALLIGYLIKEHINESKHPERGLIKEYLNNHFKGV